MSLEEKIDALIAALEQNTNALLNGPDALKVSEEPETAKPADRATTKPDNSKDRKKGKGKGKGKDKGGVTLDSIRAQAKKICVDTPDPKECMLQIAECRNEVAELCYENANVGLANFDATGLILMGEELDKFVYAPPEPENTEGDSAKDDLEI